LPIPHAGSFNFALSTSINAARALEVDAVKWSRQFDVLLEYLSGLWLGRRPLVRFSRALRTTTAIAPWHRAGNKVLVAERAELHFRNAGSDFLASDGSTSSQRKRFR
jgi:hypothetical protein